MLEFVSNAVGWLVMCAPLVVVVWVFRWNESIRETETALARHRVADLCHRMGSQQAAVKHLEQHKQDLERRAGYPSVPVMDPERLWAERLWTDASRQVLFLRQLGEQPYAVEFRPQGLTKLAEHLLAAQHIRRIPFPGKSALCGSAGGMQVVVSFADGDGPLVRAVTASEDLANEVGRVRALAKRTRVEYNGHGWVRVPVSSDPAVSVWRR